MRLWCATLLLLLASFFTTSGWAQTDSLDNKLSISLNFLTHGEVCSGGLPKSEDGTVSQEDRSAFLQGRTRLFVDYERRGIQAHATIQNNAVWGTSDNMALKLYEGWVKLTAENGLFAQIGRVALSYDDERIIGPNDFATAANSHDVLRAGYEGHGHKFHVILAYNQNGNDVYADTYYDDGAQYYKTMHTAWYHYDVPKVPLGVSLLFMNIGQQAGQYVDGNGPIEEKVASESNPPRTEYQQVYGGYFTFHPKHLTLEGSYYRQTGQMVDSKKQASPIKAWMASAKATISPTDQYGFELGYDYLSGDDYVPLRYGGRKGLPRHEVNKGFAPLYGSRTTFYGIMDYFYESAYLNGFTPGLQDATIGVFGNPIDKLKCSANYHYLAVATDLSNLNRTLGHSIELEAKYRFSPYISLSAGYTYMIGTETMECLKQQNCSKHARWGWFSLVISPSILTTKW